jgi:uncharacterized membrane protein
MLKKLLLEYRHYLFFWLVAGVAGANCEAEQYQGACEAGTGIGLFLIMMLWAIVDIILLLIWFITRKK